MPTSTMAGTQRDIDKLLAELIKLDFDAIEAYQAAIDKLDDPESRRMLDEFCNDHRRHTKELADHLRRQGGTPPSGPDAKRVLTKGKVVIGGLVGDKAVLQAMKSNEDDTNAAYERASRHDGLPQEIARTIHNNLEDERRHRAWIKQRIDQL